MTYEVNDRLAPNWKQLNQINKTNVFGILMVHFFGQPQDINKFINYSKINKIKLIEDNAHGFGGYFKNKLLGTLGDIGISSPRKITGIPSGGLLYLKNKKNFKYQNLLEKKTLFRQSYDLIKFCLSFFSPFYNYLVIQKLKSKNFSEPLIFKEKIQKNFKISFYERLFIKYTNIEMLSYKRRKAWKKWDKYMKQRGLIPVFKKVAKNSSPWAIPFYCKNIEERNFWIYWGLSKNLPVFCWPCLPDEQIQKKSFAFKKWETIVCFPLNTSPPNC